MYEYERAILFQLGKIQRSDYTPGLHFQIPGFQNVRRFDSRLQTLDAEPQRFLTGEKKDVIVDSFARWRIQDVEQFYKSTDGDPRRAGAPLQLVCGHRPVRRDPRRDRRIIRPRNSFDSGEALP